MAALLPFGATAGLAIWLPWAPLASSLMAFASGASQPKEVF